MTNNNNNLLEKYTDENGFWTKEAERKIAKLAKEEFIFFNWEEQTDYAIPQEVFEACLEKGKYFTPILDWITDNINIDEVMGDSYTQDLKHSIYHLLLSNDEHSENAISYSYLDCTDSQWDSIFELIMTNLNPIKNYDTLINLSLFKLKSKGELKIVKKFIKHRNYCVRQYNDQIVFQQILN